MKSYLKQVNLCAKVLVIAAGVIFSVLYLVPGTNFYKIWSYAATIGLAFAPEIWRHLFRMNLSDEGELLYYIFLLPAMIMGIDLDLYRTWDGFDKAVHCFSGMLAVVVAREILLQAFSSKKLPVWFKILFMVSFTALTAALWECFEFMCDKCFGQHMQELVSTGLDDTMFDIIFALLGGVVTSGLLSVCDRAGTKSR